ncbi:protein kinase [Deinococcus sp. HMF7604]|uniref:FHA domain-containing serine/threonine-protein kinase n=1 Tax=Deinococcus betulae TaxID=2873312 RepID=UPI001CCA2338|nr:FHA domain-containing serine/threonine-protein kinase [Deinococcus betulae]MBZ9751574.1 protein kinase [Deinococcus betulae]
MTDTKIFHHYQLGRLLGGGWLGSVYAATDLDENREVALRILDDASSGQSFLIMQLERLLLKVTSLRHAHILPTEMLQQRDHRAFYAMELGRQGSARQLLQSQARAAQPLPIVTATELIRQAAAGLAHAHGQGLMHGNLKPENLILQPGRALLGQTGYVTQLSDFGLAELRAGSYGTHDRAVVGALAYMSPEQCRGVRNELRTDLYALGLILYELVTGMVPFEIRDAADALEKHQHVAPRQPSRLRPEIPPALEEIILTCLAKDPDDRYPHAQALEAALQEVLNALMPGGPEPTLRLSALPVLPPPPRLDGVQPAANMQLLVFSERHELERALPVTSPTLTIGRAPDNAVVLEHVGVSRHHLNVEFTSGQAHVTELTATNGTVMDGLPLTPMTRLRWPVRTPLYLRPYWLVLVEPQSAAPRPRIVVKPERDRIQLSPGVPYELDIMLANTGRTVDHFRVSLDGIPPEWVRDAHGEVQLNPGMQGQTSLTILAPRDSRSRAGVYDVKVLARSRENPAESGSAPMTIEVLPFHDLTATLLPAVRRTWRRTTYVLRVENKGNTPQQALTKLLDHEGQVVAVPRPQDLLNTNIPQLPMMGMGRGIDPTLLAQEAARQAQQQARTAAATAVQRVLGGRGRIRMDGLPAMLTLEPGQSEEETLKVQVPLRWFGTSSQHEMRVDLYSVPEAEDAPVHLLTQARATLHHNPLIPLWLIPILLLLLGILIWWLTRPPLITQFALSGSDTAVRPGQPFTLRWDTSNARRISILELGADGQNLPADGTFQVKKGIAKDQRYTLVARSLIGRRAEKFEVVQARFDRPVIEQFDVNPPRVAGNQKITVTWKVRNAEQVTITELGKVPASGKRTFIPDKDVTLSLTAQNGTERESDTRTVSVLGPEVELFEIKPAEIQKGESAVLSWDIRNATTVTIDGLGTVPVKGNRTVTPKESTTYTVTAVGGGNLTKSANARLDITSPKPEFTEFTVTPNPVRSDGQVTINWKTKNASAVNVNYGSGAEDSGPEGSSVKSPPASDFTVTLTARNDAGDQVPVSKQITVTPVDAAAEAAAAAEKTRQEEDRKAAAAEKANIQKITFTAEPKEILGEGDVTVTWNAPGWTYVTVAPLKGPINNKFEAQGSETDEKLNKTRIYTLILPLRNGKLLKLNRTVTVKPRPAEIRDFSASSTSLAAPGPVTLKWNVANASAVRIAGLAGPLTGGKWPAKGTTVVNLPRTRTFTLSVGQLQKPLTVNVRPLPVTINSFTVQPTQITGSGTTVLNWDVENAAAVRIDGVRGPNNDGSWPAKGRATVPVNATRTFILRAGESSQSQTVTVKAPPTPRIDSFRASSYSLPAPGKVTLSWNVANASAVRIAGVAGPLAGGLWKAQGSTSLQLSKTTVFVLTSGSQQRSITVNVTPKTTGTQPIVTPPSDPPVKPPVNPPANVQQPRITSFVATPKSVKAGTAVTLSWGTIGVSSVRIEGVEGTFPASGRTKVTPAQTTQYVLIATGANGAQLRSNLVTVNVTAPASAYADLEGEWEHPFGSFTIVGVNGRRATGTFTSNRGDIPDLPIELTFTGSSITALSPNLENFRFVGSLVTGRKALEGFYTLRGQSERWCAYRPNTPAPQSCR